MILLDIIVGYFIPDLFGWIFLIAVILIEGALLSKLVNNNWTELKCYSASLIANITTTIIGFGIGQTIAKDSDSLFGHLINWIPIDYYHGALRLDRTIFIFILSFILTMIFETIVFGFTLKKYKLSGKSIITKSLIVNITTYLIGAIVLFIFSKYLMSGGIN